VENENSSLFDAAACRWLALEAFYEQQQRAHLKLGHMLTRKEFFECVIPAHISPMAIIDLTAMGHPIGLVGMQPKTPPILTANGRRR
jgi:hypothetical protein